MFIAVIITLIFAIALFYTMKMWYQTMDDRYPSIQNQKSKLFPSTPSSYEDWTGSLSNSSQIYAMKTFCNEKGYDYFPPNSTSTGEIGGCLYNQDTCEADSNPHWVSCQKNTGGNYVDNNNKPCDPNQNPYLEWHTDSTGKERCLVSTFPPSFISGVCESQGLGGWYSGSPICDSSGFCTINPNDIPTCKLTQEYCERMGLDYESDKGIGDCNLSDWQNITEGIFGKTITRTVKRNFDAMLNECHDNPLSANCALGVGNLLISGGQIAISTVDKEFQGYMDNLKQACSGNIYSSMDNFLNCGASLFPAFYLSKQVVGFADGMLDGALGWIPGMPHGLIGKGLGYVGKYGMIAAKALFHAGELAVQAFDLAGDYAEAALSNIGLGAEGALIGGAIKNIVNFGVGMAKIIAGVAQEAIHIFANTIVPAAYEVFHAVTDAFLHPKDFFNNIGNDIVNFVKDPIGSIKSAITAIAKIGQGVLDAAKMVVNYLKDVAGQLGEFAVELANDLIDLANHIAQEFEDIANDIADAAEDAWNSFTSIF
jgi:hypothetical protein